jgi:hypothetical protein
MLPLLLTALVLQAPTGATPPQPPQVERAAPRPPAPATPPVPAVPPAPPSDAGPLRGEWGQPSGKRVTLDEQYALDEALSDIAEAADWNVVLNTGRTGNKTLVLKLRNVPVEDALRAALAGSGLVATRRGNTITVSEGAEPPAAPPPVLSGFDRPTGKKFSADFAGEPVEEALRQIAKAGGLSIVLPPGEHGNVTAHFENVPVEDALRAVLSRGELVAERQGDLVIVRDASPGLPFLPRGLGRDARRVAEQAMRDAQRQMERAGREAKREDGHPLDAARDREVTGQDLVIRADEPARDVKVVGGNLTLEGGAEARDVAVIRGNLVVQAGASVRDAAVVLGKASFAGGASAREVVAVGGDVEIGPGAEIEQDATSVGGRVIADPSAEIGGSSHAIRLPTVPGAVGAVGGHMFGGGSILVRILEALVKFVVLFVLGLLVLSVFPRRLEAVTGAMVESPAKSVLAGVLGSLALPVLLVLLAITIVGLLLWPVLILAVIAASVLGITALTYYMGRLLPLKDPRVTPVVQLAIGTAIFAVVTAIPILGAMVSFAAWLIVMGAVIRSRFGQHGPPVLGTTVVPPPVQGPA